MTFESAEQIYQSMKYDDENIPFDKCVKVLGWNSSRFDIVLLWDALDCELWTMGFPIDDLNNIKSITVTCKKSNMKLQFIDAENLLGQMKLKAYVKDYGDKSEHKDVFHYEVMNSKNWKEILMKTEPFVQENFKSQLKGRYSITKDEYDQHLIDFKRTTISFMRICNETLFNILSFQRKDIFVAKHKGYFLKSEYNYLLPLSPIFRNIEIENREEVIGEYTYSQAQKNSLPMTQKDRKLTTLLEINAIAVFEKIAAYEPFVRTIMNLRTQAILAGSSKEKFYKLIIKASYGYDTLNTDKFGKIKMIDKADTFIAQHYSNHIGIRSISAKTFS
ncbi:MAG: hypothetical protein EZS28_028327, partial [Streblomastix strix]